MFVVKFLLALLLGVASPAISLRLGSPNSPSSRRAILMSSSSASLGLIIGFASEAQAKEEGASGGGGKVLILGGSGRTAMAFTEASIAAGYKPISTTRSGKDPFQMVKLPADVKDNYAFGGECDVTKAADVAAKVNEFSPQHVVFLASASKKGGSAYDVDFGGEHEGVGVVG